MNAPSAEALLRALVDVRGVSAERLARMGDRAAELIEAIRSEKERLEDVDGAIAATADMVAYYRDTDRGIIW